MARHDPIDPVTSELSQMVQHLVSQTFGRYSRSEAWSPQINIYQLPGRLEVCVDLAVVDRRELEIQVEPGRLRIAGVRRAPQPPEHPDGAMRILSMEIDYGPFRRVIAIPDQVDLRRVESRYRTGMLWIVLPLMQQ